MPVYGGPPQQLSPEDLGALASLLDGTSPNARLKSDGTLQLKNRDNTLYDTPSTGGGDMAQFLQLDDHSEP